MKRKKDYTRITEAWLLANNLEKAYYRDQCGVRRLKLIKKK